MKCHYTNPGIIISSLGLGGKLQNLFEWISEFVHDGGLAACDATSSLHTVSILAPSSQHHSSSLRVRAGGRKRHGGGCLILSGPLREVSYRFGIHGNHFHSKLSRRVRESYSRGRCESSLKLTKRLIHCRGPKEGGELWGEGKEGDCHWAVVPDEASVEVVAHVLACSCQDYTGRQKIKAESWWWIQTRQSGWEWVNLGQYAVYSEELIRGMENRWTGGRGRSGDGTDWKRG